MISDPKLPFASNPAVSGNSNPPLNVRRASIAAGSCQTFAFIRLRSARLWLRRIGVLLFVFLCATLGVMLMILPWRPEWSENPLLLPYPTLHALMASGFARGVSTGLGLLNVWIGFWEAIQYREE